jgi:homoserine dehydrogenase
VYRPYTTGSKRTRALKEARDRGIAEADSSKDLGGWDTASKLVIIANAVLGIAATLDDVAVTGIDTITDSQIHSATANAKRWKLVARAMKVCLRMLVFVFMRECFRISCDAFVYIQHLLNCSIARNIYCM